MQIDFFAAVGGPPASRRRDPATSRQAAAAARALQSSHQDAILSCLGRFGPAGKDRIAKLTGIGGVPVARRLPELRRAGLVEPTGRVVCSASGRSEREWRAVVVAVDA